MAPTTTHRRPAQGPSTAGGGRRATTFIVVGVVVLALLAVAGIAALLRAGGDGDGVPAAASTPPPSEAGAATEPPSSPTTTSGPVATAPATSKGALVRTYTGSGTKVLTIKKPALAADPLLVTAKYGGRATFSVFALDPSGRMSDILVNVAGSYAGTSLLPSNGTLTRQVKVRAHGPWTIKIKQTSAARNVDRRAKGTGDDVLLYTGLKGVATFDYRGKLKFTVQYADASDYLFDEMGRFNGKAPIKAGPALIEVRADGKWTMQVF